MAQPLPAVFRRDGQPEEAGITEPGTEALVPFGQPRVHRRAPAEFGAVGGEELPKPGTQRRQLRFVHA